MTDFVNEYLCEIPELTPKEAIAKWLEADYALRTEAFDRRTCSGKGPHGPMPANPWEREESINYAKTVRMEITSLAEGYQVSRKELREARAWAVEHLETLFLETLDDLRLEAEEAIKKMEKGC
jgi:hypothetical protein